MKIIRIPLLENKYSINCIEISYDDFFLAFEGSENAIWVYKYAEIKNIIDYEASEKMDIVEKEEEEKEEEKDNSSVSKIEKKYWFKEPFDCKRISIMEHKNTISALRFLHKDSHYLFSSGFDKYIIIWKLDENTMTAEHLRKIPTRQEITDMKLYPNDRYLFVGFINGEISIYFCDYQKNAFTSVGSFFEHDDYLNSIVLSPTILEDGLFASLSDKGKLILAEMSIKNNDKVSISTKKVFPFENVNHFSKGDTKKIDWTPEGGEGGMLISVDHQFIQKKQIIHARLIFMDDLENTQPLIGHVSSPLIARFSKCNYTLNDEVFQLLVTCDRASNIKIWKFVPEIKRCSILFTNDDFSDSIIRDIIFSNDGKYLFVVSSFGSITVIVFDELQIVNKKENVNNTNNINVRPKKKIVPELIKGIKPIIFQDQNQESSHNVEGVYIDNESVGSNNYNNIITSRANRNNIYNRDYGQILNMGYRSQLFQNIDQIQLDYFNIINKQIKSIPSPGKKTYNFENIKTKEGYYLILSYENDILNNISDITFKLSNNYVLYKKKINSTIKLFTYNNSHFAYYDSNNTINIYSLLGTPVYLNNYITDVTRIDICDNYILAITNENQIILSDFEAKKNLYNNKLPCIKINNAHVMEKINNLYFLGPTDIIFEITESSIYSNVTNKKIIHYNCETNSSSLSESDNLSLNDKLKISIKEGKESFYVSLMKEINIDYNVKYTDNDYFTIDRQISEICFNYNKSRKKKKKIISMNLYRIAQNYKNFEFLKKDFDYINQIFTK